MASLAPIFRDSFNSGASVQDPTPCPKSSKPSLFGRFSRRGSRFSSREAVNEIHPARSSSSLGNRSRSPSMASYSDSRETLSDTDTINSTSESRPSSPVSTNPTSRASSPLRSASPDRNSKACDKEPTIQPSSSSRLPPSEQSDEEVRDPATDAAEAIKEAILRRASIQSTLAGIGHGHLPECAPGSEFESEINALGDNQATNALLSTDNKTPAQRVQWAIDNVDSAFNKPCSIFEETCSMFKRKILDTQCKNGVPTFSKGKVGISDAEVSPKLHPKKAIYELLGLQEIKTLLECRCNSCRSVPTPSEDLINTIYRDYRLVLASLTVKDSISLIRGFVAAGYTDEKVCGRYNDTGMLDRPLTVEKLEQVVAACEKALGAAHDECFATEYNRQTQYEFFLPTIGPCVGIEGPGTVYTYPAEVILPMNLKKRLGGGGCGVVFEAELLPGYSELKTGLDDGRVAVKLFHIEMPVESFHEGSDDNSDMVSDRSLEDVSLEEFEQEQLNHAKFMRVKHKNIAPMLCTVRHGSENMSIYPLARSSLDAVFKERGAAAYTTTEMAHQMADLLSALDAIHYGQRDFHGYHFDVKPANILVQFDKSLALTDFGAAQLKLASDPAISIPNCLNPEFKAPEADKEGAEAHGSFDIWSMGAVLLVFLVWISEGSGGVIKFAHERKQEKVGSGLIANFHVESGELKKSVKNKMTALQRKHKKDEVFVGCVNVARLMLQKKPQERPTAKEAEVLLRTLLGEGQQVLPGSCGARRPVAKLFRSFKQRP